MTDITTPIEEGFERIFGKMKSIDTPEDTELRKSLHFTLKDKVDGKTYNRIYEPLMNLITLHTKEAYKKGYIDGGIAQLTNPIERKEA